MFGVQFLRGRGEDATPAVFSACAICAVLVFPLLRNMEVHVNQRRRLPNQNVDTPTIVVSAIQRTHVNSLSNPRVLGGAIPNRTHVAQMCQTHGNA